MKKVISMLLVAVMCCGLLVGCKPIGMNEDLYSYGVKTVEIVNSYFESDLTASEAAEKLDVLQESAESVEVDLSDQLDWMTQNKISILSSKIGLISMRGGTPEELDDVRKERDELKRILNMK